MVQENKIQEEADEVKAQRIQQIKVDLEKCYKSKLEQFYNFITHKKYDIKGDKETIKELDIFTDLYISYNLYYIFNILSQGGTIDLNQEQIGIIKMIDYTYAYSKINLNSLINRMANEYKNLSKSHNEYKKNFMRILDIFYISEIEKNYSQIYNIN